MTEDVAQDSKATEDLVVEKNWKVAGATFAPIAAEVDGEPCRITSVTARPEGSVFVNLTVDDKKRSLIAANHVWTREQQEINDSAFLGVLSGAPADATLRFEAPPKSIAEARAKNRAKAVGKRYFLKCKESDQSTSWRLVSGVTFGANYLDAVSHFDWGDKQRFSFDVITEVVDAQTDAKLSIEDMKADLEQRPHRSEAAGSAGGGLRLAALFVAAATGAGIISFFLLNQLMPPATAPKTAESAGPASNKESPPAPTPVSEKAATSAPATPTTQPSTMQSSTTAAPPQNTGRKPRRNRASGAR